MGQGRVTETEIIPRLVVGYTELGGGKLKKGKGFLEPNFELGLKQFCVGLGRTDSLTLCMN